MFYFYKIVVPVRGGEIARRRRLFSKGKGTSGARHGLTVQYNNYSSLRTCDA